MPTYISTNAEPVHSLLYLFLLFLYLPTGYPSRPRLSARQKPAALSVSGYPGFLPPDSGFFRQAAPWSPLWLIGLPNGPKQSLAKGFSQPEPPSAWQQSWRPGLPSNHQGDPAHPCPQQPPHPTTLARPVLAGLQTNPSTPRQPNSNAPPPTGSAPPWPSFASPSHG